MEPEPPPSTGQVALAYALSGLSTLLWVCCVLPSGTVAGAGILDLATPMHRAAGLVVPALLLLVVGPVGTVLARTRGGLLAVLAATDAFIALYSGIILVEWGVVRGTTSGILVGLLFGLGALSVAETARVLRAGPEARVPGAWRGLRLALCLLVLLTPSWLLVRDGQELATLLAPYALLALSAGGASLTRGAEGLRVTAALLQLAFAVHLVVLLRYAIFEPEFGDLPGLETVNLIGWTTIGVALGIAVLAVLQLLYVGRRARRAPAR